MLINQAVSALQNKKAELALKICDEILINNTQHADAYHVKALAAKQLGNIVIADECFKKSLFYKPNQPAVLSNHANILVVLGNYTQASIQFEKSIALDNQNMDAWLNWAIMFCNSAQYELAINKFNQAIQINNLDFRLFNGLAFAYQQSEEFRLALINYDKALNLNPEDVQSLHNKGVTFRLIGKPTMAIECYKKIEILGRQYPELYFNLGCAHYDNLNAELATKNLNQAITLKHDYVEAHEALNKLYWEENDLENFLKSYKQSMIQIPNSNTLLFSYSAMLIMSNRQEEAKSILESSLIKVGRESHFLHALAVIKNQQNPKDPDVLSLLFEANKGQPNNTKYQIDIANYLIKNNEYTKALGFIEQAEELAPLNQEIIAYKALCWRLLNDPRESWLNNYKQFVQAELLATPSGYNNLAHFMSELRAALVNMHNSKLQPLDQSVKGGTQTVGRLLSDQNKVIQDFKLVLEEKVQQYLLKLPEDLHHPFLKRNTKEFKFSGSWSVRLRGGGFHINHVHPEGWLSCCTYIEVPSNVSINDKKKSGWVKFGETSLALGDNESIGKEICPVEGLCVLFPSYFWHGTNTFSGQTKRMTIPCDVMPKGH